jgi:predicted kinase
MPSGNESYPPAVVVLSGLPGSGKTTFARGLAAALAAEHVESDAIRRSIFRQPAYTFAESRIVFREVDRRCELALAKRRTVVVDATNLVEEHRARFTALAVRLSAPLVSVRLTAPAATVHARLATPRDGHSQAGTDVYSAMRPTVEPSRPPAVVIDSRFPIDAGLRLVLRLLEESR